MSTVIEKDTVLNGPLWPEPVRVLSVDQFGTIHRRATPSDKATCRLPGRSSGRHHDLAVTADGVDRMRRPAQNNLDVLGDNERALYENFLVGARMLPSSTEEDETAAKQGTLF